MTAPRCCCPSRSRAWPWPSTAARWNAVPRGMCPSDSCPSTTSRPPPVRPWPLLATYRPVTQPRPSTDLHRPRNRGLRAFPAGLATTPRPHHPLLCRRAPQPAPAQERSRCCVPNARGLTLARARSPPNHADCRYRVTCVCPGARIGRSPVPRRVSRRALAERSSSGSRAATLSPLSRRRRGPAPALSSRRSRPSTITRAPPPTGAGPAVRGPGRNGRRPGRPSPHCRPELAKIDDRAAGPEPHTAGAHGVAWARARGAGPRDGTDLASRPPRMRMPAARAPLHRFTCTEGRRRETGQGWPATVSLG
jgi:hypothetical protein